MFTSLLVAILVAVPSYLVIRLVEKCAVSVRKAPLSGWRLYLIPLPLVLLLAGNFDAVLSLLAFLDTHPTAVAGRYSGNEAWNSDRLIIAGLISAAFLPFVLVNQSYQHSGFILRVWAIFALWILFPFAPLLLISGVPLQQ